jgi:hypothetical protein
MAAATTTTKRNHQPEGKVSNEFISQQLAIAAAQEHMLLVDDTSFEMCVCSFVTMLIHSVKQVPAIYNSHACTHKAALLACHHPCMQTPLGTECA